MIAVPFEQKDELFSTASPTSSPFSTSNQQSNAKKRKLILPAFQQEQGKEHSLRLINPANSDHLREYLGKDLDVSRLNKIHKHLWFAGLPRCARPLHHQLVIDRKIMITEQADLHLLWRDDRLHLKPLPDYLLSYDVWEGTLTRHSNLSENAKGFLLSYLWLIRQKSDFLIAQRENLISGDLTWDDWVSFSTAVFPNIFSKNLDGINPRYLYGELRLGRVNLIYRLCRNTRNFGTFVRGYSYGYHTYASFITRNFAWVLTVIVYITIVLTAMQVGLATTELQTSKLFNRASYGFTIFSIMAPLGILFVLFVVLLSLIIFNLEYAVTKRYITQEAFPSVFKNIMLQGHNH